MVVKTFRGLLADDGQDRIRLQTIKGKVGYKIIKFEGMIYQPGADSQESILKIYSKSQTSIDNIVNFTDNAILGLLYIKQGAGDEQTSYHTVVFDNMVFNQDIYVTHKDSSTGEACNYYIELEVIPLDDAGAEYTTLKDMRQS